MNNTSTRVIKEQQTDFTNKAVLYAGVFGAKPWGEGREDNEGNIYATDDKPTDRDVTPFYDIPDVALNREKIMKRPGYIGYTAQTQTDLLVGFIYGYETSLNAINDEKFTIQTQTRKRLVEVLCKQYNISANDPIFYLSELGVLAEARGQKIGKQLFDALDQDVRQAGYIIGLLRTTEATSVPSQKPFGTGGYRKFYDYQDPQQRILMAKNFTL